MNKFVILFIGILLISGCGITEGTIQKAERSYLVFSGNLENVKVQIDDLEPFAPAGGKQYQVSPGKHTVTASRDGRLVLNRVLISQGQVATEIIIP